SRASRSRNATTTAVVSVSPVRAATSRARRSASGSLTLSCTPQKFHPATERRGLQPSRNVERMPCESLAKILLGRSNYWEHRTRFVDERGHSPQRAAALVRRKHMVDEPLVHG